MSLSSHWRCKTTLTFNAVLQSKCRASFSLAQRGQESLLEIVGIHNLRVVGFVILSLLQWIRLWQDQGAAGQITRVFNWEENSFAVVPFCEIFLYADVFSVTYAEGHFQWYVRELYSLFPSPSKLLHFKPPTFAFILIPNFYLCISTIFNLQFEIFPTICCSAV